jgi:hypothetical protein
MIYVNVGPAIAKIKSISNELSERNLARATSRSLNETILQGRTQARAAVKSIYNIPQKNLAGVNVQKSTAKSLVAMLYASATPIPMDAFNPVYHTATHTLSVSRKGAQKVKGAKKSQTIGQGVTIEVIKGKKETIPFAFMIQGAKPRVFARGAYRSGNLFGFVQRHKRVNDEGNDIPIKPLLSVTIHAAIINKKALQTVEDKVNEVFPKIFERNIAHLLASQGP